MISSFKKQTARDIFDGVDSKAARSIPKQVWPIARRKLDMINAAQKIQDLRILPGNRLEPLKGRLKGFWSIRINEQYRIVFLFSSGRADKVEIVDCH
jgi:toxin HigB-1